MHFMHRDKDEHDKHDHDKDKAHGATATQPAPAVKPTHLCVLFDLSVWQVHDVQNKLEMAFNNKGMEFIPPPKEAQPTTK